MCGIVGQFNFRDHQPVDPTLLERMADSIRHRGPDDYGYHLSGSLGLGFRRLSIIDLAAGHQPMSDDTGKVWVVFNGEIYNFKELRAELTGHGHHFKTHSDTEVIVHGFKQWGDRVLDRLRGMYGLAIWDETRRRLLVARDPMGIKPVYYRLADGCLWFGSEIRPLLVACPQKPATDVVGLSLFLQYRYTPAPYTIHEGIRKLAAGEAIAVQDGEARVYRHYTYQPRLADPQPSDREARQRLLELYRAAIKRHLVSDVPLGLFLSGGIDSGLLLGLMSECGSKWPTFTVGYGSSFRDDELDDAAETARLYGAVHTSVRIDQAQFESALPSIVRILEEPIASSSVVPMYFVAERARQDVKVALIGQGPDELFGGYTRHLGVNYGAYWRKCPGPVRGVLESIIQALPRNESLKRGIQSLSQTDALRRHQQVFSLLPSATVAGLFLPGVLPPGASDRVLESWRPFFEPNPHLDELGEFQLLELRSSLPDELLMYGDKMSMVHGLEARVPFLDQELVEYVQTLSARFKVRHGQRKWLHRKVCHDFLPEKIIKRPKRGFAVNVVDDWMRNSMTGRIGKDLADPASLIYRHLQHGAVQTLVAEHQTGRHDHHKMLFSLALLEEWMRTNNGSE